LSSLNKLDFFLFRITHLFNVFNDMLAESNHSEHWDECMQCTLFKAGFDSVMADFEKSTLHSLLAERDSVIHRSKLTKLSFSGALTAVEDHSPTSIVISARERTSNKGGHVRIRLSKIDLANLLLGQDEIECDVTCEVLTKGESNE